MGLEAATYVESLNVANPDGLDGKNQGDDHLRLVKSTLKNTFFGTAADKYDAVLSRGPRVLSTQQLNKLDAVVAPVVGDDSADGYGVGSLWLNVTADTAYICLDASAGAAIWRRLLLGGLYVEAFLSASQSLNSGVETDIGSAVWTETADTEAAFNAATGLFTVPAGGGGIYHISWLARLGVNAGNHTEAFYSVLTDTAGTPLIHGVSWNNPSSSDVNLNSVGSGVITLAAAATCKLRAYHDTGVARNIIGAGPTRLHILRML